MAVILYHSTRDKELTRGKMGLKKDAGEMWQLHGYNLDKNK